MSKEKKDIKETSRESKSKEIKQKESKKIPKKLMGDSRVICRPHYYGIYTNAAQINGSRKKPHLLFTELDKNAQVQYEQLA